MVGLAAVAGMIQAAAPENGVPPDYGIVNIEFTHLEVYIRDPLAPYRGYFLTVRATNPNSFAVSKTLTVRYQRWRPYGWTAERTGVSLAVNLAPGASQSVVFDGSEESAIHRDGYSAFWIVDEQGDSTLPNYISLDAEGNLIDTYPPVVGGPWY